MDESFEAVESFVAADDSFMSLSESPVDEGARLTPYTVFSGGPACEVSTTLSGIVTVEHYVSIITLLYVSVIDCNAWRDYVCLLLIHRVSIIAGADHFFRDGRRVGRARVSGGSIILLLAKLGHYSVVRLSVS